MSSSAALRQTAGSAVFSLQAYRLAGSVLRLAVGEALGRVALLILLGYVSRSYGVAFLGVVALALNLVAYLKVATDQGIRFVGARAVARDPACAGHLLVPLLKKRVIFALLSACAGVAYGLWGPVPEMARLYVAGFAVAVVPYAFSLDWIAWGLGHMGWLGAWRACVNIAFVLSAILVMRWTGARLLPLTIANFTTTVLGAVVLWAMWCFVWRPRVKPEGKAPAAFAAPTWRPVMRLGAANLGNLAFSSCDVLILAGITTTAEVGRYDAVYKVLLGIFNGFYLVTQALYPRLAAVSNVHKLRQWLLVSLLLLAAGGSAIAASLWLVADRVLVLIYGSTLHATGLLRTLALVVPMDLCVALLGTVLVSRGQDGRILTATMLAAACNIGLNLCLVPMLQAEGAAWAKIVSYALLLTVLLFSTLRSKALAMKPVPSRS